MAYLTVTNWHEFKRQEGANPSEIIFTSPVLSAPIAWTEAVPTWNVRSPHEARYQFELRPVYPGRTATFFHLGSWTSPPDARHPRQSVKGQRNDIGSVLTDTLVVNTPCDQIQVRITVEGGPRAPGDPPVDFFGLDLFDARSPGSLEAAPESRSPTLLPVPERSQLAHPEGREWCSPTSVSMVLAYWAARLQRPELDLSVPMVAAGVHDPQWPGTGNWAFNVAYAGSFPGLRARVTRLRDTADLERWIQAGVPPIVSVSFDLLNGKPRDEGTGHLIVCAGTTTDGDFVVHDPFADRAQGEQVRRTVSRQTLARSWRRSNGVVYLIHPETWAVPPRRPQLTR